MAQTKTYSDFDVDFTKNEFVGDISVRTGMNAIRQSITNIIMTNPGEKPFNPEFGVGIYRELFENFSSIIEFRIQRDAKWQIESFEPRAKIISVTIDRGENLDSNDIGIDIVYDGFIGLSEPIRDTIILGIKKVR